MIGNLIAGSLSVTSAAPAPAPVAGYEVWLDASDASTLTFSSGVVVSKWTDKSASAYEFVNATVANQPSANGSQNSKTTIVFDGSNDKLASNTTTADWKYLSDGTINTVFIAHKKVSSGFGIILGTTDTSQGNVGWGTANDDSVLDNRITKGSTGVLLADQTISGTPFVITTCIIDPNNATTANKIKTFKNTDSPTTGTLSSGVWTTNTGNPLSVLAMGGIVYFTPTQIGEIIIYKSLLSDADRNANISYLMTKWGL